MGSWGGDRDAGWLPEISDGLIIKERNGMTAKSTSMVRAVQGEAQLHERGSNADWFWVDYLIYYEHRRIRAFVYVRRKDGTEIPDDDYDVVDELSAAGSGGSETGTGRLDGVKD